MSAGPAQHLVIDDAARGVFRVDRRAFTDPAILAQERRDVFDRCWLYAGHVSEIAKPRDYLARKVGGRPIILLRDEAGTVRAFLNSCPHRGNILCRERSGAHRSFICSYHGWAFNLEGALIAVSDEASYGPRFDRGELGLTKAPRMEIYRGLIFIAFDPGIVDLPTYLGNAREYLDLMLDYSGNQVEVVPGSQSYSMKANWKLLVENSIDAYHALHTHRRFVTQYLRDMGIDNKGWLALAGEAPEKSNQFEVGRGLSLGNGHALTESLLGSLPYSEPIRAQLDAIRCRLIDQHGLERTRQMADYSRNLLIFPNLIFIANWRTIRTFYPTAPDFVEIDSWAILPSGEPPELRQARLENFISFLGPAGFGTPDDVEMLEGCQRGFANSIEQGWSDVSRGMTRAQAAGNDELQMRAFWRRWHSLISGDRNRVDFSDHPIASAAE